MLDHRTEFSARVRNTLLSLSPFYGYMEHVRLTGLIEPTNL